MESAQNIIQGDGNSRKKYIHFLMVPIHLTSWFELCLLTVESQQVVFKERNAMRQFVLERYP